ncbi:MAG: hypothetical protein PHG89_10120 [Gallionella sp.]|nr:hypothetical protein [Gallionella sp.]
MSKLERDIRTQPVRMFELRGQSVDQGKIFCQCIKGHCFLEKDAEWAKQNRAQALHPNGIFFDRTLFVTLDVERLHEKSEWMDSLGVVGTYQICCRHKTEKLF